MSAPRPRVQWVTTWDALPGAVPPADQSATFHAETAQAACQMWVNRFIVYQGSHWYATIRPDGPPADPLSRYICSPTTTPGGTNTGGSTPVIQSVTYYPDSDYPDDELPCPRVLVVTPAERRLLSDLPGAQQSRGISRQYLASERIEWAGLTQAQADRLAEWWTEALEEGGNWFVARKWPTPQGVPVNRRWKGALSWRLLPSRPEARVWTVSGECEVRRAPPEAP